MYRLLLDNICNSVLNNHYGLDEFFFGDGRLVIAEDRNDIVGFLEAHKRKNSAPVKAEELFINYIIIFESELHHPRQNFAKAPCKNERMILGEKGKTAFMVYYTHCLYLVQYNIYRYIC